MAVKIPETKDEQDAAYNPGELHAAEQFKDPYTSAGIDQAEAYANDSTNNSANTDDAKQKEEATNAINYTGSGKSNGQKKTFKAQLKKRGPMAALLTLLIGGFGGMMIFIAPGLAVVHMAEVLTEDLNDQLGAMDIRTTHVFKAKLKGLGKSGSVCTGVKVRCGFKGMSDRQLNNFKKAGITVETDGKANAFGKKKVTSMKFDTNSGSKTVTSPKGFNDLLKDSKVRNSLRRAFNPKLAGFSDFVSFKVFGKLRTSKANKLTGDTDEEKNKNLKKVVAGEKGTLDPRAQAPSDDDSPEERERKEAANKRVATAASDYNSKGGTSTKQLFSTAGNVGKNAAKGILVTGAVDTACTVANTARGVSSVAKVVRGAQLARFAMVFLTFASAVKAGDATADQAEYVGNKLTAVDTDEMVYNETSPTGEDGDTLKKVKNPDLGKSAFDSDGFKVASYNDAPNISARTMQYTVGGTGLMGTLSSVNAAVSKLGGSKCKFVQNNVVRLGSAAIGIGLGLVTVGTSLAASVGASTAIGMALPILQNYLANMLAGTVVDEKTKGVDAGNAIFAGTAKLQGDIAMGRGMEPQSKDEFKNYLAVSNDIKDEYIAMETADAKATPFDIYNQYSFMGSITRSILPIEKSTVTASGTIMNSFSMISSALQDITPLTHAKDEFNPDRFSKCDDYGYKDVKIDADVFCNVRYGLSAEELSMDTDTVIDYMYPKYLSDDGSPQDKYEEWLALCVNRTAGWGESPAEEENNGTGFDCKEENNSDKFSPTQLKNFRVYTMDQSISEAMEYIEPTGGVGLKVGTYNILYHNAPNVGKYKKWQDRADGVVSTMREQQFDVLGVQEMTRTQYDYIKPKVSDTYAVYPDTAKGRTGYQRSIWWNSAKYTKVEGGTYVIPRYKRNPPDLGAWVKLSDNTTGQTFYFFSHHNSAHGGKGSKSRPDYDGGATSRRKSTKELLAAIDKNVTDDSVVVALGDFNSLTKKRKVNDSNVAAKDLPYNLMKSAGFINAEDVASSKVNAEYDTSHSTVGKQEKNGSHIDYVFIKGQVTVTKWENIINETTRISSDHTPVVVNILSAISATSTPGSMQGGDDYKCTALSKRYGLCGQCTDFVAFRLQKLTSSSKYQNNNGNGKDVAATLARKYGFKLDNSPAAGAVVSFKAGQFGMNSSAGHVAMVKQVNSDGSIIIEDYNRQAPLKYGTLTISKAKASQLSYAHSEVEYK